MTDVILPNSRGRCEAAIPQGAGELPRRTPAGSRNIKTLPAVVDTFVRAIKTSDFDRRLRIVEADLPARPADVPEMFDAGNPGNSICWRDSALDTR
jgi:hypothetical protein